MEFIFSAKDNQLDENAMPACCGQHALSYGVEIVVVWFEVFDPCFRICAEVELRVF